jgi:adenylosuccinate lyase
MRRYGLPNPYEQLKALTRQVRRTSETLHAFIDGPRFRRREGCCGHPATHIGKAAELQAQSRSQAT